MENVEAQISLVGDADPAAFQERIGAVAIRPMFGVRVNTTALQAWQVVLIARPRGPVGDGPYRTLAESLEEQPELEELCHVAEPFRDEYDAYRKAEILAKSWQVPLVDLCGPVLDWRLPEELDATLRDRVVRINRGRSFQEAPGVATMPETRDEVGLKLQIGAPPFPFGPAALIAAFIAVASFVVLGNVEFRHAPDGLVSLAGLAALAAIVMAFKLLTRRPDRLEITPDTLIQWFGKRPVRTSLSQLRGLRLSSVFSRYTKQIVVTGTFLDFLTDGPPLRFYLGNAEAARARWTIESFIAGTPTAS